MSDFDEPTPDDDGSERDGGYNPDDPEKSRPVQPWHVAFVEWVQTHFAGVEFFTAEPKIRWCPTWWEHPEAVSRLTALWSSYVHVATDEDADPAAISSWWLHHWDPHRAILFHDKGPFRNCDFEHGHLWNTADKRVPPLPATPPSNWVG